RALTVRDSTRNPDFFAAITIRISVDFPDVCLAGAGSEQQRRADQDEENSSLFQYDHGFSSNVRTHRGRGHDDATKKHKKHKRKSPFCASCALLCAFCDPTCRTSRSACLTGPPKRSSPACTDRARGGPSRGRNRTVYNHRRETLH